MAPDFPRHQGRTHGADDGSTHLPEWETMALDYLDDRLPNAERALVDAHLATCAQCRRDLEDQHAVRAVFSGVALAAPPPALAEVVLARILVGAASAEAVSADGTGSGERPASMHALPRAERGSFVSRLLRPRVWMPAAAAVLLTAVLLSQFQPTTGDRVSLQSAKEAGTRDVTTTAAAAATATTVAGAGPQTDAAVAGAPASSTTLAGGDGATATAQGGSPPIASVPSGTFDESAKTGSLLLDPFASPTGSLWIEVGGAGPATQADAAWMARTLTSLVGAVPADLPSGATAPVPTTPLYVANVAGDAVAGLLARMAQAGLNPRVTFAPPTLDAAVRGVHAAGLFPAGSAVDSVAPAPSSAGAVPGKGLLLMNIGG